MVYTYNMRYQLLVVFLFTLILHVLRNLDGGCQILLCIFGEAVPHIKRVLYNIELICIGNHMNSSAI